MPHPHPYDPAALAALGHDRVATDAAHAPVVGSRAAVVVRFQSDAYGRNRWVATLKRSTRERAARLAVPAAEGPDAAAAALIARQGLPWRLLPAPGSLDGGESYAYVAALTPGEGLALAHGDRAALAITACRELLAALAGGGDAEALALPAALARMATGAAPVRPVVTGWVIQPHRVALTDALGQTVLALPDTYSPAGALAAAQAAGWQLTAEARAVAARHPGQPDPAGVAEALAALGGCPAVVAALDPARGLL